MRKNNYTIKVSVYLIPDIGRDTSSENRTSKPGGKEGK